MSLSKSSVVAINLVIILLILAAAEVAMRFYIQYSPTYYTGIQLKDGCIEFPYGTICYNSLGYPDKEFNLQSNLPRIGYVGDSICFGVGAGQEYRITTLLEKGYPGFEHWNIGRVGSSVMSGEELATTLEIARKFKLSHLVYLMNLNDIAPNINAVDGKSTESGKSVFYTAKLLIKPVDDLLRGRSYLYTQIRNLVKERLTVAGYEASGYKAIEMYPDKYDSDLVQFAAQINDAARRLSAEGIKFTVIMLPYEMQISEDAARTYQKLGISWEPSFLEGRTQQRIADNLENTVQYVDALHAFDGLDPKVGEYFVFDKGDKIDWNHPNKKGHRQIAEYLIAQHIF